MDQITLKRYVRYDERTGEFYWLARTPDMFRKTKCQTPEHNCSIWNGRYAGKLAGYPGSNGRWLVMIEARNYKSHRLAWLYAYGECPPEIDHKDGNSLNNRIDNLRPATRSQNMANIRKPRGVSGIRGVYPTKPQSLLPWEAKIRIYGRNIRLGSFATKEEAGKAYRKAAIEHYGEFAPQ